MAEPEIRPRSPVSPCVGICLLDPADGRCRGCLRTVEEIRRWYEATDEEKHALLDLLASRRAALEAAGDG